MYLTQNPSKKRWTLPSSFPQSEHPVKLCLVGHRWIPALIGRLLRHVPATSPGWCQVLKHGLVMGGEHVLEIGGHGIWPEEIVIQGVITVYPLGGIQDQQLVYQVQRIRVFDVGFEPLLHLPLLPFGQVQLRVQLVLVYVWPNLRSYWKSIRSSERRQVS